MQRFHPFRSGRLALGLLLAAIGSISTAQEQTTFTSSITEIGGEDSLIDNSERSNILEEFETV